MLPLPLPCASTRSLLSPGLAGLAGLTTVLRCGTNCYESRTQLVVELFETSRGFGVLTEALSILGRRKSFKKVYLR